MATNNKTAGVINLKRNGTGYAIAGTWRAVLQTTMREGQIDIRGGAAGYSETGIIPFIEGDIITRSDVDFEDLMNMEDETITLELTNGKVGTLRNAWFAGEFNVDTTAGTVPVRFEGMSGEWDE